VLSRLFILSNLLLLNLLACQGGYNSCQKKIRDSHSLFSQTISIPIKNHKRIIYSKTKPKTTILKHDPFLSLYMIIDNTKFKYPFETSYKIAMGMASVNSKRAIEGRIARHQIGLNKFALFSEVVSTPSLLLTSCCSLEGFVTPEGIIEKEYIDRFITIKNVSYSDIGIRVKDEKKLVIVDAINPFLEGNNFKIDDCIVTFDGKKVKNAATLMRWILFSKIGSHHTVKIKRANRFMILKMQSSKRNGGGYLSDTFLEFLGISFDKNLKIISIKPKAEKYQLKIGDKLIQINQKKITTEAQILKMLSEAQESSNLLFQRDGFQFFVKIKSI